MGDEFHRTNTVPKTGDGAANAEQQYTVSKDDLPLHCPMDGMSLWNSHPRVYLSIEETGKAQCPYCGARFILKS